VGPPHGRCPCWIQPPSTALNRTRPHIANHARVALMSEPPSMLRRGALYPSPLSRYKLMGVIGQGAFSEVWVALDRNPDKGRYSSSISPLREALTNALHVTRPYVAVKCYKPTSSNQSSAEVKVLREIRQKAHSSRHTGASRIMPLLDDFIVPASDPSSPGLFH